jgi:hypothetical protein
MAKEDHKLRIAIIAGATEAIKYLQQNKNSTHDEALRHVANNTKEILARIDGD